MTVKNLRLPTIAAISLCCVWAVVAVAHEPETAESFQFFLKQSQAKQSIETADVDAFYKRALTFWNDRLQDYEAHPEHYQSLLALYYEVQARYPLNAVPTIERFRPDIEKFKELDARNTLPASPILFVGSSSVVFWETAHAFPAYPVINRGFGGSTLADVNYFYDDVVKKYLPAVIVVYCDNDIYRGDAPDVFLQRFEEFATRISRDLPGTALLFLSMKPTPSDAFFGKRVRANAERTNRLVEAFVAKQKNMRFVDVASVMYQEGKLRTDIFLPDGVHMNAKGYALWNPIVGEQLAAVYQGSARHSKLD